MCVRCNCHWKFLAYTHIKMSDYVDIIPTGTNTKRWRKKMQNCLSSHEQTELFRDEKNMQFVLCILFSGYFIVAVSLLLLFNIGQVVYATCYLFQKLLFLIDLSKLYDVDCEHSHILWWLQTTSTFWIRCKNRTHFLKQFQYLTLDQATQ